MHVNHLTSFTPVILRECLFPEGSSFLLDSSGFALRMTKKALRMTKKNLKMTKKALRMTKKALKMTIFKMTKAIGFFSTHQYFGNNAYGKILSIVI